MSEKHKPGRPPRVEAETSDTNNALEESLQIQPLGEIEVEETSNVPKDQALKQKLADAEAKLKEAEAKIGTLAALPENKKRLIDYEIHHNWPEVNYEKPYFVIKGRMRDSKGKIIPTNGRLRVPVIGEKGQPSPIVPVVFKDSYGVTNHRLAARTLSRRLVGGSIESFGVSAPKLPDITVE